MGEIANFTVTIDTSVLDQMIRNTPGRVGDFLDQEAEVVVNDIKMSIQEQSHGLTYTRGGKTHIASKPYDPPNIDRGGLINSIEWRPKGKDTRTIHGLFYGWLLEFGTTHILPRPFIGPAMMREERSWARRARAFGLVQA